jgi:hypothetical protein
MRNLLVVPAALGALMLSSQIVAAPAHEAARARPKAVPTVAVKTVRTPGEAERSTTLATAAPGGGPVSRTVATTDNASDKTATTRVVQTSTKGTIATPEPKRVYATAKTQVRCMDGTVLNVRTVRHSCDGRGGPASSVTTSVMRTPAGQTTALVAKAPGGPSATAVASNTPNAASTTRVTQTTVYQQPPKKR